MTLLSPSSSPSAAGSCLAAASALAPARDPRRGTLTLSFQPPPGPAGSASLLRRSRSSRRWALRGLDRGVAPAETSSLGRRRGLTDTLLDAADCFLRSHPTFRRPLRSRPRSRRRPRQHRAQSDRHAARIPFYPRWIRISPRSIAPTRPSSPRNSAASSSSPSPQSRSDTTAPAASPASPDAISNRALLVSARLVEPTSADRACLRPADSPLDCLRLRRGCEPPKPRPC